MGVREGAVGSHGACVPQVSLLGRVQHAAILLACLSPHLRTVTGERDAGCAASPASLAEPLAQPPHFSSFDQITKQRECGEKQRRGGGDQTLQLRASSEDKVEAFFAPLPSTVRGCSGFFLKPLNNPGGFYF